MIHTDGRSTIASGVNVPLTLRERQERRWREIAGEAQAELFVLNNKAKLLGYADAETALEALTLAHKETERLRACAKYWQERIDSELAA